MRDQVDALRLKGIPAANLDSTLSPDLLKVTKEEVMNGKIKLLYVAPERLNNEGFIQMMSGIEIELLAVDESHCISEWGNNFRPDYLKISRFATEMNVKRVLCLTATATPKVAHDICESFGIDPEEGVFKTPVYRPKCLHICNAKNDYIDIPSFAVFPSKYKVQLALPTRCSVSCPFYPVVLVHL